MPEIPNLPHGQKGQPILPSYNDVVDALNRLGREYAADYRGFRTRHGKFHGAYFLATTYEHDRESEHGDPPTGPVYNLKRFRAEDPIDGQPVSGDEDSIPQSLDIVQATNLAEWATGSHLLTEGTLVQVFIDSTPSGQPFFYFDHSAGGTVDLLNNDTPAVTATPFVNIKGVGTENILEFDTDTVSGRDGGRLALKGQDPSSPGLGIYWNGSVWRVGYLELI